MTKEIARKKMTIGEILRTLKKFQLRKISSNEENEILALVKKGDINLSSMKKSDLKKLKIQAVRSQCYELAALARDAETKVIKI